MELAPATADLLAAALDGPPALAARLAAEVPSTWPPEYLDSAALAFVRERVAAAPDETPWWMYFMVLHQDGGERVVIGTAAYKGPPTDDGTVEIGYGVVRDRRRRGFASEAVRGLLQRAFGRPEVRRVIAETLPELTASIGVLRKCGFTLIGEGSEPGVIRYELLRPASG
jgi:RimJ/RimL family protein N-acetyltransferase